MPKTIAILYICTGSYRVFWPGFYENFRQNFLPELDKTFFVFTDAAQVAGEDNPDVRRIPQKALPWPYSTLSSRRRRRWPGMTICFLPTRTSSVPALSTPKRFCPMPADR